MTIALFAAGQLIIFILFYLSFLFLPRQRRVFWPAAGAFGLAQAVLAAGLTSAAYQAGPIKAINAPIWVFATALLAVMSALFFYRYFSGRALAELAEHQKEAKNKIQQVKKAEETIAGLKSELQREETRLTDSLKFYSTVRELAECVDFDHMKRVLERDLRQSMPYLAGFSLFVFNEDAGRFEPQIQHQLWLEPKWIEDVLKQEVQRADKVPAAAGRAAAGYGEGAGGVFFQRDPAKREIMVAPIVVDNSPLGFFLGTMELSGGAGARVVPAKNEIAVCAATLAQELRFGLLKALSFARVERLSRVDGLTGIYRRGIFDYRIEEEIARSKAFKNKTGLMILDIDHFKELNDKWGHPFGDIVLRRIATIIKDCVYETDFVARYGGEEFAVILTRSDEAGAQRKAEQIRRLIEKEIFYHEDKKVDVKATISIGLAFYPQDADGVKNLIRAADEAMYFSKQSGRNRVTGRSQMPL
ncbi:MAG: GGDEF domain-containing protein [Elusimicrobia bacterium]|nr:GGDEF domain-containing protein [Elusimicrobiota bacterium]